jgi:hypothetical protein
VNQVQHPQEGGGATDEAVLRTRRRGAARVLLEELDVEPERPVGTVNRPRLDRDVDVAAPGVVDVQDPLCGARALRQLHGAYLAGLVAGHGGCVGDTEAGLPDHVRTVGECAPVGMIRGEDPVIGVHGDGGTVQTVEDGAGHDRDTVIIDMHGHRLCHFWRFCQQRRREPPTGDRGISRTSEFSNFLASGWERELRSGLRWHVSCI